MHEEESIDRDEADSEDHAQEPSKVAESAPVKQPDQLAKDNSGQSSTATSSSLSASEPQKATLESKNNES